MRVMLAKAGNLRNALTQLESGSHPELLPGGARM